MRRLHKPDLQVRGEEANWHHKEQFLWSENRGRTSLSERTSRLFISALALSRTPFSILCPVWAAKRDGYPLRVARYRGLRLKSRLTLVLKARRRSLFVRALGFGDIRVSFLPVSGDRLHDVSSLLDPDFHQNNRLSHKINLSHTKTCWSDF